MRTNAAIRWRAELDGVMPAVPQAAAHADALFGRRPCDLVIDTGAGRAAVRQSAGRGLPVLLLHGAGASKDAFRAQFDGALAQAHRLVALDLPEGAPRDRLAEPQVIALQARAAAEAAGRLGLERVALVGWGRGAAVATALAAARTVEIAGVLLTGVRLAPMRADVARLVAAGTPIAAIQGAEDPMTAGDDGADLGCGPCYVIPRAGHAPFLDSPGLFNPLLGRFLNGLARRF